MAGIYIHIPFCKVKCHYCDFHFSTQLNNVDTVIEAMCKEITERKHYLNHQNIKTIYLGGGTPSILSFNHLEKLIDEVKKHYDLVPDYEFTIECNPDDITLEKLNEFKQLGINRLSIGIQSFDEDQLKSLNRAHNAKEARQAVELAIATGFDNITIDLIYGLPDTDENYWRKQIEQAIDLGISHISSYCLTFEEKTVFGNWLKKGKIKALPDETSLNQFKQLCQSLEQAGYEHYEISNFALPGFVSKHNSSYWLGASYIGIGPSAHSFNGKSRQWNMANNAIYSKNINSNVTYYEVEVLTENDRFNEYIMTRIRTKWGIELDYLKTHFPQQINQVIDQIKLFIETGKLQANADSITLTKSGKFLSDHITEKLFIV